MGRKTEEKGNFVTIKKIALNAIVAAVYFVICLVSGALAYEQIQFRIAELLVLLCFWRRDLIIGVTLGCFLANVNSTLGPWDMLFGTILTLVSCVLVAFSPKMLIACIWPIVFNAFGVAAELYLIIGLPYWINVLWVGIGEATVIIGSYILWMILWRNKAFMRMMEPDRISDPSW